MSIAITTPTGHIGSHLVSLLLAQGADLTLLVRHPEKLADDVRSRVNVQQGELQDREFVLRATEGAEQLFWLAPPNYGAPDAQSYYQNLGATAAQAVEKNRIRRAVFISSGGGGDQNAGLISHLFHIENMLNATDADVLSLRCGFFMENFFSFVPTLRQQGAFYSLNRPDLPLPMVATADIAAVAARKLLDPNWSGKQILAVHGAADITPEEAARILTETAGKPIHYVQIPPEPFAQSFSAMGASPDITDNFVKMMQAFDRGIYAAEPRTPETTTSTTLAEWSARELLPMLI